MKHRPPWEPPPYTTLRLGDQIHLRDPVCGSVSWDRDHLDLLLAFLRVSAMFGECIADLYCDRVDLGPVTQRLQLKLKLAEIEVWTGHLREEFAGAREPMRVWELTLGLYDRFVWIREHFPESLSEARKAELDAVTEKLEGMWAKLQEHRELGIA